MKKLRSGFTMVEFTVTTSILAVFLLEAVYISSQVITTYQKGYTINTINRIGRELIDELSDTIKDSSTISVSTFCTQLTGESKTNCEKNRGLYSVYQQYYSNITITDTGEQLLAPTTGVFCTGKYSYLYNTGYLLSDSYSGGKTVYLKLGDDPQLDSDFHLYRIYDSGRELCTQNIQSYYPDPDNPPESLAPPEIEIDDETTLPGFTVISADSLAERPLELLPTSESEPILYEFTVTDLSETILSRRLLFSSSFILGTTSGGINTFTSGDFCPRSNAAFNSCAVYKFSFSTRNLNI